MIAGSQLLAVGAARADTALTAQQLGAPFGKDQSWVEARTGITALRRLAPGQPIVDLAVSAGRDALDRAGVHRPDLVITTSCSAVPATDQSQAITDRLAPGVPNFQVNAACSGFSYALATADAMIRVGQAGHVLIVAAEHMSRLLDATDLGTSIIFGDGAGAAVLGPALDEPGIGPVVWGSDGARCEILACDPDEVGVLRMQGQQVFRWAVETVPHVAAEACARAGVHPDEIEVFVPHQANLRIIESVVRRLGLDGTVIATDITRSGNTSSASIPMALAALADAGSIRGGLALLVGFGAGLTHSAQVVMLPSAAA